VGSIAMRPRPAGPHQGSVELGYAVYQQHWGAGYAREAVDLVTAHAFAAGFVRVEIECAVDNIASAKTALNAGFRYEGTLRKGLRLHEHVDDSALFGRIVGDPAGPTRPGFPALPADGLSDGVIRLRGVEARDADAFFEQEDDELTTGYGFTGAAPDRAAVLSLCTRAPLDWLAGQIARIAIDDLASGRFAGSVSLRHPGPPGVGGIGYTVHPAFRGRGITARALRLLAPWAFDAGYARLELGAKADNVASQRAAVSGGFTPDGTRAARLRNPDGSYSDEVRFARVNPQTARRINP
jgi:RimJ/RimL family protein N-acetyltransferase